MIRTEPKHTPRRSRHGAAAMALASSLTIALALSGCASGSTTSTAPTSSGEATQASVKETTGPRVGGAPATANPVTTATTPQVIGTQPAANTAVAASTAAATPAALGAAASGTTPPLAGQATGTAHTTTMAAPQAASGATASTYPVVDVVKQARPGVVQVTNEQMAQSQDGQGGGQLVPAGAGTGFLFDQAGYILTNNHVVAGAQRLTVTVQDGRTMEAKLVGADPRTDIAVLKIDDTSHMAVVPLGDSNKLQVGQPVVAIGNALALPGGPTVTTGVVSALGRSAEEPGQPGGQGGEAAPGAFLFDLIQTDAAINPGNSGGPLLNLNGEVIGINTLGERLTPGESGAIPVEGINFAIASNTAIPIAKELIANGQVTYGFLGVSTQDNSPALAARYGITGIPGAVVVTVVPGSPAAQAGLHEKDLIIGADGQPVQDTSDLRKALWNMRPGDQVKLTVAPPQQTPPGAAATAVAETNPQQGVAGIKTHTVQATLAERPANLQG